MACKESICRKCFHSYVCEKFNENKDDNNEKCHFFNDHYVPTADVVPRAMTAEIFEEIEKVIGEQYENYVFDNLDIEGAEQDAIIAFVDVMKRHFAELKKKYTEGENKQKDFFSPEEVRAMSRKEVRENYTAIMNSMKKW